MVRAAKECGRDGDEAACGGPACGGSACGGPAVCEKGWGGRPGLAILHPHTHSHSPTLSDSEVGWIQCDGAAGRAWGWTGSTRGE